MTEALDDPHTPDDVAEMFRRHRLRARRIAVAICGPDDADDAVQTAVEQALKWCARLDRRDDMWPWFATCVRNAALTIRRRRRSTPLPPEALREHVVDPAPTPPDHAIGRECERAVADAVDALRGRERRCFVGVVIHGTSALSVAAAERSTPAAVRQVVCRARCHLGQRLRSAGYDVPRRRGGNRQARE